ncbi:MAG TPA: alpha/beta hydrolase, partial [bacterium]|nr:alpha/beta hydrolase [bacterium]
LHHLVQFFSKEQKPILVGHSWGAVLALLYAAKHKTSAHGIVVIGTGPLDISVASKMNINIGRRLEKKDKQKITALKKQIVVEKDEKNKALLDLAFLKLVLPHYNVSHRSLSCLQLGLRNTKTVDKCSADYTEKLTKGSLVRCLKKISLPVTGIYGYCDPIPVPLNTSLLKKNIPQYTDIIIKNAGHFPWLEPKARQVFLRKLKLVLRHM